MHIRNCFFFHAVALAALFATSCAGAVSCTPLSGDKITVMEYNAQAFFDATETGSEFAEFRGAKTKWNAERYGVRLDRLREAILLAGEASGAAGDRGPDVAVLAEIENEGVVRDLCNRMPRNAGYRYAAFAPPGKGSAFGCAVISRLPMSAVTVHSLEAAAAGLSGAGSTVLRPLLEVRLDAGETPLVVFAAHWKSKSGDGESAGLRAAQEDVLLARIREIEAREPGMFWLACGDFNQKLDEFSGLNRFVNPWSEWLAGCEAGSVSGPAGTYWYDGNWETIDHFFLPEGSTDTAVSGSPGFRLGAFRVIAPARLLDKKSHPAKYEVYSGYGYSDHLPIMVTLERAR
jgi:endonuclease/exonuclease/phosphatase family metal-dependent hydrolase